MEEKKKSSAVANIVLNTPKTRNIVLSILILSLLWNGPRCVEVDGVVGGEGVPGVGATVVRQDASRPVHGPQVQPLLQRCAKGVNVR